MDLILSRTHLKKVYYYMFFAYLQSFDAWRCCIATVSSQLQAQVFEHGSDEKKKKKKSSSVLEKSEGMMLNENTEGDSEKSSAVAGTAGRTSVTCEGMIILLCEPEAFLTIDG